jgi:hypothetical protein
MPHVMVLKTFEGLGRVVLRVLGKRAWCWFVSVQLSTQHFIFRASSVWAIYHIISEAD